MSIHSQSSKGRLAFASKTAFEILASPDDDEQFEEDEQTEELESHDAVVDTKPNIPPAIPSLLLDSTSEPPKPSKSAQKRAARTARRQEQGVTPSDSDRQTEKHSGAVEIQSLKTKEVSSTPTLFEDVPAKESLIQRSVVQETPVKINGPQAFSISSSKDLDHAPLITPVARKRKVENDLASNSFSNSKELKVAKENHYATNLEASKNPQQEEKAKKLRNVGTRTLWTLIMIAGFLTLLAMGHAYMILLVLLCQSIMYREVTSLFTLLRGDSNSDEEIWRKTLNWYFFAVANYFLYGESIISYFKHVVFADALLFSFATNHRLISFILYTIGFVGFVTSLKKQFLKQQFALFCWVHMSLFLIVVSSHFIVNNILEGLIWFWVPAFLVISNDIFAYIWGMTLGRTPLIKLSPKKTVEGFVGALFTTLIFGIVWGTLFMEYDYMVCPVKDLGVSILSPMSCRRNPAFIWRAWVLPVPLKIALSFIFRRSITQIHYATYQFHVIVMAMFASLVAPFGGFFASGFKRAFGIKDFGDSIPGHGGMTDRMDCQFLMGMFSYVYYGSVIRENHTVESLLQAIVFSLNAQEQLQIYEQLTDYLIERRLITGS